MKLIIIYAIILSFVTISCRTASRTVEKERESIDSLFIQKKELELKNDSTYFTFSDKSTISEFTNLLSAINWNYSGKDSAEIEIIKTESGIKIKTKGTATAELSAFSESELNKTNSTGKEILQVQQTKSENLNEKVQVKSDKSKVDKKAESKTNGFQFSFWLYLIAISVVIIALYWFFGRPKK